MNEWLFNEILKKRDCSNISAKNRLNQHVPEFQTFLQLSDAILRSNSVEKPVVVEIGILDGSQKEFYEQLLNAEYIGIDINPNSSADIIGDSGSVDTVHKLLDLLDDRTPDLVFIDGLHTYDGVKADYEMYAPLANYIIGVHDILTPKLTPRDSVDVARFWKEVWEENKDDTIVTIRHHNSRPANVFNGRPLGIGVVIKGQHL